MVTDSGSNHGVDAISGLILLFTLSLAPGGFSPGTPVFFQPIIPRTSTFKRVLSVSWVNKLQLTFLFYNLRELPILAASF